MNKILFKKGIVLLVSLAILLLWFILNVKAQVILPPLSCRPSLQTIPLNQTASFTATGGSPPYYWSASGGTPSSASNTTTFSTKYSTAGTKTVTLRDSKGQESYCSVQVILTPLSCGPSLQTIPLNQTASFTATGGSPPYYWSASGGTPSSASNTTTFSTKYSTAGTKTVTLRDSKYQESYCSVVVSSPPPPTSTTLDCSPPTQTAYPNQDVTFNAQGGNSPYTWQASLGNPSSGQGGIFTTKYTRAGSYTVYVRDKNGKQDHCSVSVQAPPVSCSPPTQTAYPNQDVTFNAQGGNSPYTWQASLGNPSSGQGGIFTTKYTRAGSYTVYVRDQNGKQDHCSVSVQAPPVSCSPPTQTAYPNQDVTFNAQGGNSPYTWQASLGNPSSGQGGIFTTKYTRAGSYTVYVRDQNGRQDYCSVSVQAPPVSCSPPTQTAYPNQDVTFNAQGGNSPYTWQASLGNPSSGQGGIFTTKYTRAGSYTVYVRDQNGRQDYCSVSVQAPPVSCSPPTQTAYPNQDVTFNAQGGNSPYTWQASLGNPSSGQGGIFTTKYTRAGSYTVYVRDQNGRQDYCQVRTLPENEAGGICRPLNQEGSVDQEMLFYTEGGTPPFYWSAVGGNPSFSTSTTFKTKFSIPGVKTITVQKSGVIQGVCLATVLSLPTLSINPSTANTRVNEIISFTATGGSPPYYWSALGGNPSYASNTTTFSTKYSTAGTKTVTLRDSKGQESYSIVEVDLPLVKCNVLTPIVPVDNPLSLKAEGGVPPYRWQVVNYYDAYPYYAYNTDYFSPSFKKPGQKIIILSDSKNQFDVCYAVVDGTVSIYANDVPDSISVPSGSNVKITWYSTELVNSCLISPPGWTGKEETVGKQTGPLTTTTTYTASCNLIDGSNVTDSVTVNIEPLSPTVDIKANNSDGPITLPYNNSATISWTSQNVDSCTVLPPNWTGTQNSGTPTGPLTSSRTYTITCTGSNGSATDSVTVNILSPPSLSPTVDIKANNSDGPITLPYNNSATISWTSQNVDSCTVLPPNWTGTQNSGTPTGPLTSSRTYTITCTGSNGSATDSVTVNILSPPSLSPTVDIKANNSDGPITLPYNNSATISWTSQNVDSCTVLPPNWTGTQNSGIPTGPLTSSRTYTITCTGSNGSATDSVTVNILSPSLSGIKAGFMCSLDNTNWKDCEKVSIKKGDLIYLKDDPSLSEFSSPSSGATIISRIWKINNQIIDSGNNQNVQVNISATQNKIELIVTDSAGQSASKIHTLKFSLPLYRELP